MRGFVQSLKRATQPSVLVRAIARWTLGATPLFPVAIDPTAMPHSSFPMTDLGRLVRPLHYLSDYLEVLAGGFLRHGRLPTFQEYNRHGYPCKINPVYFAI